MYYRNEFECGCMVVGDNAGCYTIEYCPKHGAAPLLYEALKIAIEDLRIHLGEWVCVTLTYSPEWTHTIKRTISDLEEALGKAEVK